MSNATPPITQNRWVAASLIFLVATLGCSGDQPRARDQRDINSNTIEVLVTTGMVADLVRKVGGSHVNVTQLMGPGIDPHLYKPNRDDIQSILDSDIVFYSGFHLEGKMTSTLNQLASQKRVVAIAEKISDAQLIQDEQGQVDPHLWMDIELWSKLLLPIANELTEISPNLAEEFRVNAMKATDELKQLHEFGIQAIATIPESKRVLITSHDAFQYFGRAYQIEVAGIQGLSTESEAGLQRINQLVDMITLRQISAIFVESSVPAKNIESLIEGANARSHQVKVGGELYSDAMGAISSEQGTYIGMMSHNLKTVVQSLGGTLNESPPADLSKQ